MIHKVLLLLLLTISFSYGQEIDSTIAKTPKKAALWSILPGGGQIYNGKYLKAGIIITLESLAIWQSIENGKNYEIDGSNSTYLQDRNKFAWWAFFIHIYGLLDAVVDSHMKPFGPMMENDTLEDNTIQKETEPSG